MPILRDRLQSEGVLSRWNHGQGDWSAIRSTVQVSRLQPSAQPGIVNLRLVLPKAGRQPALDLQMIQLQLDKTTLFRKIPPDIGCTNVQPGDTA
jgi:hypothetical protein